MITETIQFTNFNDEPDSRTLHFHISEAVLMDNMNMRDRLQGLVNVLSGEARQLSVIEIQEIVDIVKWFMAISYGLKAIDGSSFDQDRPIVGAGPIWHGFQSSPAYSAFLMSLFKEPEKAVQFIINVLPAELRAQAEAEAAKSPQMQAFLKDADKNARPAPGTRIVDDATLAAAAENAEGVKLDFNAEEPIDFDAMLMEAGAGPSEPEKKPITQQQHDYMRVKLNDTQFEHFMSDRVLVADDV